MTARRPRSLEHLSSPNAAPPSAGLFSSQRSTREPASGPFHYVRVAVERSLDAGAAPMESALTYRANAAIPVGRRVEVPLGRGNTPAQGVVVASGGEELLEGFDPERVKFILADAGAALTPTLVELARWISAYYVCPLGMVLSAMVPAAVKHGVGARLSVVVSPVGQADTGSPQPKLSPMVRSAFERLGEIAPADWPLPPREVALRLGLATIAPINRLIKLGLLVESERRDVRATGEHAGGLGDPRSADWSIASAGLAPRDHPDHTLPSVPFELTTEQAAAAAGISAALGRFGVHLLRGVTGSGKTEVYLRVLDTLLERDPRATAIVLVPEISLTPQTAGRFLARLGRLGPDGVAVLHSGLSRSQRHRQWRLAEAGKARVVIGARSAVFAPLDRVGLIIVDEEHAEDYKQDQAPRYHGRDVAVKRAQLEGCPVLLGSATPSLESWSNAISNIDTSSQTARGGKYALWELPRRVGGATLPRVEIADLVEERRLARRLRAQSARSAHVNAQDGFETPARPSHAQLELIGPTLQQALSRTLDDGGQAILMLNRRGYAGYIACPDAACGYVLGCEHCDATLVHHKPRDRPEMSPPSIRPRQGRLGEARTTPAPTRDADSPHHPMARKIVRCHHCLESTLLPQVCPLCGNRLIWLGMGTQRVEEELHEKFGCRFGGSTGWLARVDSDSMHGARAYFDLLARFASGAVRVLCGTQMLAKGHDFPNVRLVGVVNADTALNLPDFRAEERTFQLVSQVAGRAGRSTAGGLVIVQTMDPRAASIVAAANHDYIGFAAGELAVRRRAGLPPVRRMARVVCRDADAAKAERRAREIAEALRASAQQQRLGGAPDDSETVRPRIAGPMPCPIARIAGQHRIAVEVTCARRGQVQDLLARARDQGLLKSDAHIAVDVDPVALM